MKPRWVIDPRHSKAMQVWDVVIVSVLLFTALVTPVEVSFLPPPETASDPLFLINRLVDALFIGDLCLQFVLMYPEESREGARWVFTPSRIWWHYLTGWFLIDFVSIVVSTFDYISISATAKEGSTATLTGALLNTSSAAGGAETGQAAALSTVAKLKALRVLRVLRLIKLLRLLRMSRIFKRWETRAAIDYSLMALMKVFTMLLLWAHLCACLWTLQTDLFFPNRYETWLGEAGEGLCVARLSEDGGTLEDACRSPGELYVASLYWSVMTITSIGYGDISATRWPEQVVAICVMLLGSILWGQVIGTIVSTISTFNPEATEFRRTMDDLNRTLPTCAVPARLMPARRSACRFYSSPNNGRERLACVLSYASSSFASLPRYSHAPGRSLIDRRASPRHVQASSASTASPPRFVSGFASTSIRRSTSASRWPIGTCCSRCRLSSKGRWPIASTARG